MRKNALICVMLGMTTSLFIESVSAWCFSPYVGLDAQGRHMNVTRSTGQHVFKHDMPQGNVYAGVRVCDYLGLEAGYEWTKRVHKEATLGRGEAFLNSIISADIAPQVSISTARLDGWHADLVGFLPVCEQYCSDLFVSVGIAQMRAYFQPTVISFAGIRTTDPSSYRKNKTITRANIGFQSIIIGNFGVRLSVGWENTSRMSAFQTDSIARVGQNNILHHVKLRDSFNYGLGIFFSFL